MRAIVAYMHWLGSNVIKGEKPLGAGITSLKISIVRLTLKREK
jgi:thiosulfate dehydrogenase